MRARMALMQACVQCELREVVLRDKPEQMLALSAKGTVPVLQLPGGEVIDESLDVMHWALAISDPQGCLAAQPELSAELIAQNDSSFKDDLDRYKYHVRYPDYPQRYYRERAEAFLVKLEKLLGQHQGLGLVSNRLTLADLAILPFVRQFSHVDRSWFEATRSGFLTQWLQDFERSDLFLSVMNKYAAWSDGDPITVFAADHQQYGCRSK